MSAKNAVVRMALGAAGFGDGAPYCDEKCVRVRVLGDVAAQYAPNVPPEPLRDAQAYLCLVHYCFTMCSEKHIEARQQDDRQCVVCGAGLGRKVSFDQYGRDVVSDNARLTDSVNQDKVERSVQRDYEDTAKREEFSDVAATVHGRLVRENVAPLALGHVERSVCGMASMLLLPGSLRAAAAAAAAAAVDAAASSLRAELAEYMDDGAVVPGSTVRNIPTHVLTEWRQAIRTPARFAVAAQFNIATSVRLCYLYGAVVRAVVGLYSAVQGTLEGTSCKAAMWFCASALYALAAGKLAFGSIRFPRLPWLDTHLPPQSLLPQSININGEQIRAHTICDRRFRVCLTVAAEESEHRISSIAARLEEELRAIARVGEGVALRIESVSVACDDDLVAVRYRSEKTAEGRRIRESARRERAVGRARRLGRSVEDLRSAASVYVPPTNPEWEKFREEADEKMEEKRQAEEAREWMDDDAERPKKKVCIDSVFMEDEVRPARNVSAADIRSYLSRRLKSAP